MYVMDAYSWDFILLSGHCTYHTSRISSLFPFLWSLGKHCRILPSVVIGERQRGTVSFTELLPMRLVVLVGVCPQGTRMHLDKVPPHPAVLSGVPGDPGDLVEVL